MASCMTFIFCQGPARQQSSNSSQPLPPGWEACTDQATGRTYYQCHHTQATQWEHPAHTDQIVGVSGSHFGINSNLNVIRNQVLMGRVGETQAATPGQVLI